MVSVQRTDGTRISAPLSVGAAEEQGQAARALLAGFNQAISGAPTEDALARPSPEACRYCSFRGACHPFLESTGPDWEMFRATAKGTVGSVEETRQGPRLTLDVSLGTVRSGTTCRVSAIPEGEPVGVGDTVAVSDAVHSKASNDLRMEWDSVLWRW